MMPVVYKSQHPQSTKRNPGMKNSPILNRSPYPEFVRYSQLWIWATLFIYSAPAQNWTKTSAPRGMWWAVASSADGSKLVGLVSGGPIYTSTNSGLSWQSNLLGVIGWYSAASSADGTKLAAAAYGAGGGLYTSTN